MILSNNRSRVRKKYLEKKMIRINVIMAIILFVGLEGGRIPRIAGVPVGDLVFLSVIIIDVIIFVRSELPILKEMRRLS